MKSARIYVLGLILILLISENVLSQGFNGFNQAPAYITAHFRQENLIIEPEASFFNVLIIENKGERREEVNVEINVPIGWSIMADESRSYLIDPGDSVLIPVRAAASKGVEGEIGYSVIAAINTRSGETLTNAYCFIKIPRESNFRFRPITRVSYFDQQTGTAEISFMLLNQGNVSELVYLNFVSTNNVVMENERDNTLNMDLVLKAKSDTTITIPVRLLQDFNLSNGSFFRVDLNGYTQESQFNTSFWFNNLTNKYKFNIPESEKILIAELAVQNLLSEQPNYYAGGLRGNVLFNNQRDLNYVFYRYGSGPINQILKYSRTKLEYNTPSITAILGDITSMQLKYGGGKGAEFRYRFLENFQVSAMAGENSFRPIRNFGAIFEEKESKLNFQTRYTFTDNKVFDNQSHIYGARSNFNITPGNNLRMDLGFSDTRYNAADLNSYGYGMNLEFSGKIRKTIIRFREQFGSANYYGHYSGRHNFLGRIYHPLRNGYDLDLGISDQRYKPLTETNQGIRSNRFQDTRKINLTLRRQIDKGMLVYAGPVYERKSSNSFLLYDGSNPFTTNSAKLMAGARISDSHDTYFSPSVTLGYTFITNYSVPDPEIYSQNLSSRSDKIFNSLVSLNLRRGFWGTYLNYFYGPYSINQELNEFYYRISTHTVRIMPYLERYLYKDQIKISSKFSFLQDFTFKTSRLNFNNQLDIYLKNDFTISLLNTFSHQITTDLLTEESYKYSNNYFEVRLTKEFNWNQPRVKYYDLNINLFKDLNGNLARDFNEPGVKDILVNIESIDPILYSQYGADYEVTGTLVTSKLLTGMDGTVLYENLARGVYRIELINVGRDQDKYFPDQNEFIVTLDKDKTVYTPYLERNKIFGRVIMNRSKLSNLGRVEVSNLKVSATDSKDRTTSTLTDANGYFEMYVPSVDSYVVTINDIFQEHFNLRQNRFRANLNGFKQFEVTFVFDEIRRQIEFTPGASEIEADIRRVGRTNLSGLVRDASTLQTLRAQIEIISTTTNSPVERTVSDRTSGKYNSSFITGNDYAILVTAPGYWMHSERLMLDEFLTIQDVEIDILLENIVVGAKFELTNLSFTSGSTEITNEALPELERITAQLKDNPNVRIRIVGHSDAVETLDNRNISMSRAEMVMRYMVRNGYSNIEFTGLQDTQPLAPNDTEDNRRRNRRIEIIIVAK